MREQMDYFIQLLVMQRLVIHVLSYADFYIVNQTSYINSIPKITYFVSTFHTLYNNNILSPTKRDLERVEGRGYLDLITTLWRQRDRLRKTLSSSVSNPSKRRRNPQILIFSHRKQHIHNRNKQEIEQQKDKAFLLNQPSKLNLKL